LVLIWETRHLVESEEDGRTILNTVYLYYKFILEGFLITLQIKVSSIEKQKEIGS